MVVAAKVFLVACDLMLVTRHNLLLRSLRPAYRNHNHSVQWMTELSVSSD
jgi:hypothetical protein